MSKLCSRQQRFYTLLFPIQRDVTYPPSIACVSQDPSTKRRHPRGYIEFLEQHNTSLENHVAALEKVIRQHQPNLNLDALHDGTDDTNDSGQHEEDSFTVG
jgi:hypothetical protein